MHLVNSFARLSEDMITPGKPTGLRMSFHRAMTASMVAGTSGIPEHSALIEGFSCLACVMFTACVAGTVLFAGVLRF